MCYNILSGFVGDRLVLAPESFRHQTPGSGLAAMGRDKANTTSPNLYICALLRRKEKELSGKNEKKAVQIIRVITVCF